MHLLKSMMMNQIGTACSKPLEVVGPKVGSQMSRKGTTTT